jgi:SAM-dependent methyltransferase
VFFGGVMVGATNDIRSAGHVAGFREAITTMARVDDDAFFGWFDHAEDTESSFVRGSWDFMLHIGQPLAPWLERPEQRVALEIGHGGGRILAAASRCFQSVIGVDIHDENDKVQAALLARGVTNARLMKTEGALLPVESELIDCVYSFIVLQHVETYSVFERYFAETFRVLKPGGVAVLYFGRRYRWSFNRSSRLMLLAPVNSTNLRVSLRQAKSLSRSVGFNVMRTLVSRRRVPDGVTLFGGQHGLVLRKPACAKD